MHLYPGAHLIECEMGGRPLHLPLLVEGDEALLMDCGARSHAANDIPKQLEQAGVGNDGLTWLILTHPDLDHCGGLAEIKRRYPRVRIACGDADRTLIESPENLFNFRYDVYRQDHGIFYDPPTAQDMKDCCSGPQHVTLTFTGGERLRLGQDRVLEIWHLPGHSHGHLGVYDRNHQTLFFGDAIHGAGFKTLEGGWALCPTYLYVDAYLATIRAIENCGAEMIVGCHWRVCRGAGQIREFCAESRDFVLAADRLIHAELRAHPSGRTLRELCEALGNKLGEWPPAVNTELAWAFTGHLDRAIATGTVQVDRSRRPVVYRHVG